MSIKTKKIAKSYGSKIKYIEKKNVDYKTNEKILSFLKLIIKIKLSENHNPNFTTRKQLFKYKDNE